MKLTCTGDHRTTTIESDQPLRCLSWAPFAPNGPITHPVHTLVNATLGSDEFVDMDHLDSYCLERLRSQGLDPTKTVMLLTAVPQTQLQHETVRVPATGLQVDVFCTAGMGNAIAPGDPALYDEELAVPVRRPGTINLIVIVNRCLTDQALLELVHVATMAKCQALFELAQKSSMSDRIALGTGTDCIAIAGLAHADTSLRFGGLGTRLGSITAQAVSQTLTRAIQNQRTHLLAQSH